MISEYTLFDFIIDFIRIVFIPIFFVLMNFIAEILVAVSGGVAKQNRSIRILFRDGSNKEQEIITDPESIIDVKTNFGAHSVVSVDKLASPNWYDYSSVPLNLCFTALGAAGAAFFSPNRQNIVDSIGWVFIASVGVTFAVLILSCVSKILTPAKSVRWLTGSALFLSFTASIFSFAMLWEALK